MSESALDVTRVDILRAALRLAERGYYVFPCHSIRAGAVCSCGSAQCGRAGKHPRTREGFKEAVTGDDKGKTQITKWWLENPDANIGLVPWPSGLIILDIDPRNSGFESLKDIEQKYGTLPDTARVFTGGGGLHIYFTLPTGIDKVPSRVLRPGVELKAMGGYVLAPPSSHLAVWLGAAGSACGPGYAWDGALGDQMVDAPFWLCEAPPPGKVYERSGRPPIEGVLGAAFTHAGMTGRMVGIDKVTVQCPWEGEHSSGAKHDSSTVVFGPSAGSNLGWFHCVAGDSRVVMHDGETKPMRDVRPGDAVLSKLDSGIIVANRVLNFWKLPVGERSWVRVGTLATSGAAKLTDDHRVKTANRGEVVAGLLLPGDELFVDQPALGSNAYQVALGSLLGDGSFEERPCSRLVISHCDEQKPYLRAKADLLWRFTGGSVREHLRPDYHPIAPGAPIGTFTSARRVSLGKVNSLWKNKAELFSRLDWPGLAIWYQDDGYITKPARGTWDCAIAADWATTVDAELLQARFGVRFTKSAKRLRVPRIEQNKFFRGIAPFVHPSMARKLPAEYQELAKWDWPSSCEPLCSETDTVTWVAASPGFRGDEYCYDIEVEESHNFFVKNSPSIAVNVENCSHGHCADRTARDVLAALPKESVDHAKEVVPKASKALSTIAGEEWEKHLARAGTGQLQKDPGNLRLLIENLPDWTGALALDESKGKLIWRRDIPGAVERKGHELRDGDYIDVGHWFRMERGVTFRKEVIVDVLHHTGERAAFNSLQEHLISLKAGSGLLDSWLVRYCNAEDTPYTRSVGRWWLISAMARALDPGVQVDHSLVLEGDQGAGKSTLFRILGGEWYDGTPPRFDSTDAMLSFQGVWIRELSELAGTTRTEFATIKAILTERVDRFRPPYGRHMIEAPRRCVFCASVNPGDDYIRDPTGARRFWPVKLPTGGVIELHLFAKERDALLGEALQAYRDGEPFHPPTQSEETEELVVAIRETQGARQVADPWADAVLGVARFVETGATMGQIFSTLGVPIERQGAGEARRVAAILRANGYERKKRRNHLVSGESDKHPGNAGQHWVWVLNEKTTVP